MEEEGQHEFLLQVGRSKPVNEEASLGPMAACARLISHDLDTVQSLLAQIPASQRVCVSCVGRGRVDQPTEASLLERMQPIHLIGVEDTVEMLSQYPCRLLLSKRIG
jgi:hypothetical protein